MSPKFFVFYNLPIKSITDFRDHILPFQCVPVLRSRSSHGRRTRSRKNCCREQANRIIILMTVSQLTNSLSSPQVVQIILSTAHPAKFREAVELALRPSLSPAFNFDRDVLPTEFIGMLERKKRVIEVEKPDIALVKSAMEDVLNRD